METQSIAFDRGEARALYREYRKHLHWSAPIDRECMRAYQLIAQGRAVIRALESIKAAGVYTAGESVGLPKLGLCRADATACFCAMSHDGSATMTADDSRVRVSWGRGRVPSGTILNSRSILAWPAGSFPYNPSARTWRRQSLVPPVPLHLRPKRGLQNYHVLWEAEWVKAPPDDPMLLRRIGGGDLWLVVASWNLTAVEKAALAARV
jgi:hypothetical protein